MSPDGDTIGRRDLDHRQFRLRPPRPRLQRAVPRHPGCLRARRHRMSTLKEHLARGTGPRGYRLPGGSSRWRFTRRDVDVWIKGHEHPPPSERVERLARLQAGGERAIEKKRARRRAEINEDMTA